MECIAQSEDGYGVFGNGDELLYGNRAFFNIFGLDDEQTLGLTFAQMINSAYQYKRGLNIETEDIEAWLNKASLVRRQLNFRIFEVDMLDGRWLLLSEQLLDTGELLVHSKDITKQKLLESQMQLTMSQLQVLALTDELTQLANRRSFVKSVEAELSRFSRSADSVAMILLDLDFFKTINDTFGHQAGDEVLICVADILRQATRQYDIVGRLGGEEFAIFLGATELKAAIVIAQRIAALFSSTSVQYNGQLISVKGSMGITSCADNVTFEKLYNEADKALYLAKLKGRNRIEVFNHQED